MFSPFVRWRYVHLIKDYKSFCMLCFSKAMLSLNNCLLEGWKICQDLETNLYSRFKESLLSNLKLNDDNYKGCY